MKRMQKTLSVTALSVAVTLAGWGSLEMWAAYAAETTPANKTIGVLNQGTNYPYPGAIGDGIQQQADKLGYEILQLDAGLDPLKQARQADDLIVQKPAAIILMAVDGTQATSIVDKIAEADIPLFSVRGQIGDPAKPLTDVYPGLTVQLTEDEVASGKIAAQLAIAAFPDGARYAIVEGAPGFIEVAQRAQEFDATLQATGKFEKVASQPGNWRAEDGNTACQNMLQAHPDITLFYAESDDMATGCAEAVASAGSTAKVIGLGGSKLAIQAIKEGKMLGTICYKPLDVGMMGMQAVADYLEGRKQYDGAFLTYVTPAITKDNLAECEGQW